MPWVSSLLLTHCIIIMSQKWTLGKIAGLFVGVALGSAAATVILNTIRPSTPPPPINTKGRDNKNAMAHAVENLVKGKQETEGK